MVVHERLGYAHVLIDVVKQNRVLAASAMYLLETPKRIMPNWDLRGHDE